MAGEGPPLGLVRAWTVVAVVVISGVVLVLGPEIEQVTHPSLYDTDPGPTKLAPGQALAVVHKELPEFDTAGTFIYDNRGAWEVHSPATGDVARVDDTDGKLLGTIDREHGVMAFIANLHECGLTCEEMSGYIPFLAKPAQIWGFDLTLGNEGNWGGFILAVGGILLLLLVVTGLVIWWPRRGGFRRGLKVRRGKGLYKLNYDLHKVVGFVALPALAIWAITGINFELPKQTEGAFYAVTPGSAAPDSIYEFESKPGERPRGDDERGDRRRPHRRALRLAPRLDHRPGSERKRLHYEIWFAHGVDTYAYGYYPGNYGVYVDRYSGKAHQYFPNPANDTVTNNFMQNWAGAIHMGTLVGWLPRTGWILFGLTPLLLAVTGTVTWLMRRRMGRRKKRRDKDGGAAVAGREARARSACRREWRRDRAGGDGRGALRRFPRPLGARRRRAAAGAEPLPAARRCAAGGGADRRRRRRRDRARRGRSERRRPRRLPRRLGAPAAARPAAGPRPRRPSRTRPARRRPARARRRRPPRQGDRMRRLPWRRSDGPATPAGRRALIAAYAFMALAAGARAAVQIATEFDAAPLAFTLSATSAAIYLLAAVALRREGPPLVDGRHGGLLGRARGRPRDRHLEPPRPGPLPRRHRLVGLRQRLRLFPARPAPARPPLPMAPPA